MSKVQIYQGMIQHIIESTNYTLQDIAELSSSSTKNLRSIYSDNLIPPNFSAELQLVTLYRIILEVQINESDLTKDFAEEEGHEYI